MGEKIAEAKEARISELAGLARKVVKDYEENEGLSDASYGYLEELCKGLTELGIGDKEDLGTLFGLNEEEKRKLDDALEDWSNRELI